MKIVENNKSTTENYEKLGSLINSHVELLSVEKRKNKKKIIELCHAGKFLMLYDKDILIKIVTEEPDFILEGEFGEIGLEHQIIIEQTAKQKEGFYEKNFSQAEHELQSDPELPNFLANCYLLPHLNFKAKDKDKLVLFVKNVVKEFVLRNNLIENPIIDRIFEMPHTQKSISPNLGAWWEKDISLDLIKEAILKKEGKITGYKKNGVQSLWLLLVIGGVGDSSYNMNTSLDFDIQTHFDKVFILEDFRAKLYELK